MYFLKEDTEIRLNSKYKNKLGFIEEQGYISSMNEQLLKGVIEDVRFPLSFGTLLEGKPNTVHPR